MYTCVDMSLFENVTNLLHHFFINHMVTFLGGIMTNLLHDFYFKNKNKLAARWQPKFAHY
jgi:hypothetical protein